ncbi:MAG: hypothetical protein ABIL58_23205 [Pseudomonadota bacterium]
MPDHRVFTVYTSGTPDSRKVLKWGVSRFGNRPDPEVEAAVGAYHELGKTALYTGWVPEPMRFESAEKMLAHRIRNAKARVRKKDALFYDDQLAKELSRPKYTIDACRADLAIKKQLEENYIAKWWAEHTEAKRVYAGERPAWKTKVLAARGIEDIEAVLVEVGMTRHQLIGESAYVDDKGQFVMVGPGVAGNYAWYRHNDLKGYDRGNRIKIRAASGTGDVAGGAGGFFTDRAAAEAALAEYAKKNGWSEAGPGDAPGSKPATARLVAHTDDPLFSADQDPGWSMRKRIRNAKTVEEIEAEFVRQGLVSAGFMVDRRIEEKYRSILSIEHEDYVSDGAIEELLVAIEDRVATPGIVSNALKKVAGLDNIRETIEAVKATIADQLGDLIETYKYESHDEGKSIETYLDGLLSAVENHPIPSAVPEGAASGQNPGTGSDSGRGTISDDGGVGSPLRYDPGTNRHNGQKLTRGDILTDDDGNRYALDRDSGFMLTLTRLTETGKPSGMESVSVDPTDKTRFKNLHPAGGNIYDEPGPAPPKQVGEIHRIGQIGESRTVAVERIEGVDYELFQALEGDKGAVRIYDADSGEVVSLTIYPSIELAEASYREAVGNA